MWTLSIGMWYLVPWPGFKPRPSALGEQSLKPSDHQGSPSYHIAKSQIYVFLASKVPDFSTIHHGLHSLMSSLKTSWKMICVCRAWLTWFTDWLGRGLANEPPKSTLFLKKNLKRDSWLLPKLRSSACEYYFLHLLETILKGETKIILAIWSQFKSKKT